MKLKSLKVDKKKLRKKYLSPAILLYIFYRPNSDLKRFGNYPITKCSGDHQHKKHRHHCHQRRRVYKPMAIFFMNQAKRLVNILFHVSRRKGMGRWILLILLHLLLNLRAAAKPNSRSGGKTTCAFARNQMILKRNQSKRRLTPRKWTRTDRNRNRN